MRKRDELTDPNSCLSKARDDEMLFVLLGRDAAAPAAVQAWINERIERGKNAANDEQIQEAERWIEVVKSGRGVSEYIGRKSGKWLARARRGKPLIGMAKKAGRDYITPEDVQQAIDDGVSPIDVASAVLAVIGNQTQFGAEDPGLCAFVAWQYMPPPKDYVKKANPK